MKELIAGLINAAVEDLIEEQPDILDSTEQTTMTEWNFAHHFSFSLAKYLFWFDHDIDVVKKEHNSRPDIIYHKRRSNENNFLAIEVKKSSCLNKLDNIKIEEKWFSESLNYQFGACLSITEGYKYKIKVIENDPREELVISGEVPVKFRYEKNAGDDDLKREFLELMNNNERLDLDRIKGELEQRYSVR